MPFDYKKEYREFYLPKNRPELVCVPAMNFLAIRGSGDPNQEDGAYKQAIGKLYGVAFTLKMSRKAGHDIEGFFEYVVPPLEGFWWMEDGKPGIDYSKKENFQWISLIRLPDFVTRDDFLWAVEDAARKKQDDFSDVEFFSYTEGECVQCMHLGPYDGEPETIRRMEVFAEQNGRQIDISKGRFHHEIYLSDARRCDPKNLKTVIRLPVKAASPREEELV